MTKSSYSFQDQHGMSYEKYTASKLDVYMDETIGSAGALQRHPLIDTAELFILRAGIDTFVDATGHRVYEAYC